MIDNRRKADQYHDDYDDDDDDDDNDDDVDDDDGAQFHTLVNAYTCCHKVYIPCGETPANTSIYTPTPTSMLLLISIIKLLLILVLTF